MHCAASEKHSLRFLAECAQDAEVKSACSLSERWPLFRAAGHLEPEQAQGVVGADVVAFAGPNAGFHKCRDLPVWLYALLPLALPQLLNLTCVVEAEFV